MMQRQIETTQPRKITFTVVSAGTNIVGWWTDKGAAGSGTEYYEQLGMPVGSEIEVWLFSGANKTFARGRVVFIYNDHILGDHAIFDGYQTLEDVNMACPSVFRFKTRGQDRLTVYFLNAVVGDSLVIHVGFNVLKKGGS